MQPTFAEPLKPLAGMSCPLPFPALSRLAAACLTLLLFLPFSPLPCLLL
jgi:hypothetical protein